MENEYGVKMTRFIIGRSWDENDVSYFDIIDTHPLRDKEVVSFVTEYDTDNSGMNFGFTAAAEEAEVLNKTYGYDSPAFNYNLDAKMAKLLDRGAPA